MLLLVSPGGGFVVGGAGGEAAVQDADQAVGELAERGVVADAAGAQRVVVGAGAGEARSDAIAWRPSASFDVTASVP
jgi:hypothetical protein